MTKLRCKHRHTIEEHPQCFRRWEKTKKMVPIDWKLEHNRIPQWYDFEGAKIGYLDIEATDFKADKGLILSWALKERNKKTKYDFMKQSDRVGDWVKWDYRLVQSLIEEMKNFDVLVTYYGTGFDKKFILTRAFYHNIPYFRYGDIYHIDLYYLVRNKFLLWRNGLQNITELLEISGKTKLGNYWKAAVYGSEKGMKELLNHNIQDVEILEKLHNKVENLVKFSKNPL